MSEAEYNRERALAKDFILHTTRNVFLTGKAGTGKTTLLKEILDETDKNYIVAAPTGVAAINAGGITLHSLFLLPLKSFVPIKDSPYSRDLFCDVIELVKHQKFNRAKLDLLLELEMLVIDEISMVRADIFDAIDHTLRRVRKNQRSFGGVQLVVIGDLFQLAPVVRGGIEEVLRNFYKSPYFFDARAWEGSNALAIELKKVYRQEDMNFVQMLNSIRDGKKDENVIAALNAHYDANPEYADVITLTTHNRKADKINQTELEQLDGKVTALEATITGKFYENAFPTPEKIELKKGAQVMFIRNHSEGLYFNGKIGTITEITRSTVKVKGKDGISIIVEPVEWKNSQYKVDGESGKIIQEDIGTFVQYPLRLAWAVTVHKSQGLTFDKVILDLEGTFASGQLYVALSRCRSLEGMILSSHIKKENVITDSRVLGFTRENELQEDIELILKKEKERYEDEQLLRQFDLGQLGANLEMWEQVIIDNDNIPKQANCLVLVRGIKKELDKVTHVTQNFMSKLGQHLQNEALEEGFVEERMDKAIQYFTEQIYENILSPIVKHGAEYSVKSKTRTYLREVDAVEETLWKVINKLYNLEYRGKLVLTGERKYKRNSGPKPKPKKAVKGESVETTFQMFQAKKSLKMIAKERGLVIGTIESHISQLIKSERISIFEVMKAKKVEQALAVAKSYPDLSSADLIKKMPMKMSFGELRWVLGHRDLES